MDTMKMVMLEESGEVIVEDIVDDDSVLVAEEVVVNAGGGISARINEVQKEDYGVELSNNTLHHYDPMSSNTNNSQSIDANYDVGDENGVGVRVHQRDGTDEMSVAIDLARLSQGHYPGGNDNNGVLLHVHPTQPQEVAANATTYAGDATMGKEDVGYVFYTEDGRVARSLADLDGQTVEVDDSASKPRMSYAQLIAEAIVNSKKRQLTLAEIYSEINRRHPYYTLGNKNWQNSIRHNLTLNKGFKKVPRENSAEGRGSFWTLEPGAEEQIFKRTARINCGGPAKRSVASTTATQNTTNDPPRSAPVHKKSPQFPVISSVSGAQSKRSSPIVKGVEQRDKIVYVTVPASGFI